MGVHGLTTFIEGILKTDQHYREKIIIRGGPVVIDGSNLMYHLYFDGKAPVIGKGGNKAISELNGTSVPNAHLYGGDWLQYAQNVRYFFQQLKHCDIIAIVIFDGAYDADKIEVARKRFAKTVTDNVRKASGEAIPEPGKTYTPIFLKSVFLEVLAEQKVAYYQTVLEADQTIAFVAKLLGRCPILSSDSDFFIYSDAVPVSLKSLKFSLKKGKSDKKSNGSTNSSQSQKVWTLEGERVSLAKICSREFGLTDEEMLPLAAVILGNDSLMAGCFHHFVHGQTLKKRVEHLFKWLARQKTVESAFQVILSMVNANMKKHVAKALHYNLCMYKGESGEMPIWELIKEGTDLSQWIDEPLDQKLTYLDIQKNGNMYAESKKDVLVRLDALADSGIKCTIRNQTGQMNPENDGTALISTDDDGKVHAEMVLRTIPRWYRLKHQKCELQTYLLNLIKNLVVFLPPQVEIIETYSTHEFSIPIIGITAGILVGKEVPGITLESQRKGRVQSVIIQPVTEIDGYGKLPFLRDHGDPSPDAEGKGKGDFVKSLSHENRVRLMLAALGIWEQKNPVKFYEGWPVSYRIWIATLMYFIKQKLNVGNPAPIPCLAIILSIFLCIIKNLIVNPGKITEPESNKCLSAINALHKAINEDAEKLKKIRQFYQRFEDCSEANRDKSKKVTYDISLSYSLSQYLCVVYHSEMLNSLMGNPLKPAKIRYTVNNFFIYNFARFITDQIDKSEIGIGFNKIVRDAVGVAEIDEILFEFLGVVYSIEKFVPY